MDSERSTLGEDLRGAVDSDTERRELALARVRHRLLDVPLEATRIGRFTLIEHLGTGGFGSVWSAYDPTLDRKVALKLLRSDEHGELLTEARALAKLAHPNVVTVHEVAQLDDRIVIVMELVPGAPIDRWIGEQQPSAERIVAAFVDAGRGLAAAHAQGLVHRDVKPGNLLVGDDGRGRIADFGLARTLPEAVEISGEESDDRTFPAGTPKYWAPELRAHAPASRASDQYAFCLSLSLMLERVAGYDPVRGRVARIVARGLAADPAQRWPSMDALVAALDRKPLRRGRAVLFGGAIVLAAIGPWAIEALGRQRAAQRCHDDANAGEWSTIAPVHTAFTATGLDYAEDTWTRVEPVLAAYPQRWRDAFAQACLAQQHDRSCFEHRRLSYASLVDTLAVADADVLRNAVRAVHDLPALEPCADDAWLRQHPVPADAEQAAQVLALRGELARASWTRLAREPDATTTTMLALHDRARAIGWDPLLAEVELELGAAYDDRGDAAQAETTLTSAYRRAGAAGLDLVAADAAIGLVTLVGSELARPEAATIWATNAQMLLDRQGDAGRRRGQLAGAMVGVHRRTGDLAGARAAAEESLAAYRNAPDATELAVFGALGNLAVLAIDTGELARGAELLEETLVAKERILGPNHPGVMGTLINLGALALQRGAYEEALAYDERALVLAQRLGEQHPDTLGILGNLSLIQLRLGDREQALVLAQKVVDGRTALLGALHPDTITAVNNVAAVQIERGNYAEAAAAFEDVLARQRKREQTAPLELARTLFNLGAVRVKLGKAERAPFDEALAIHARDLPADHPETEKAREGLAVALIDLGELDEAEAILVPLLATRRRMLPANDPLLAMAARNLGLVALQRGDLDRALVLLREAAEIHRAASITSLDTAAIAYELGEVHARLQQRDEAIAEHRRALALLGENHAETIASLAALRSLGIATP